MKFFKHAACLAVMGLATVAQADIKIGVTTGITGAQAAGVADGLFAAKSYIAGVNAAGGIKGNKIELKILDDKFDPKETVKNTNILAGDKEIVALFANRGTPNTQAMMPILEANKLVLLAPGTGAMLLHDPVHPYIFNVRPTYQEEAEKAILQAFETGASRVAVVASSDSFGEDGIAGAQKGFKKLGKKPVLVFKHDRSAPNLEEIVEAVKEASPQRILLVSSGGSSSAVIKAIKKAGLKTKFSTLGNNASAGFINQLGASGVGVVVTQVFPNERDLTIPMILELNELAIKNGKTEVTPAMAEGFAYAKVLVAALRASEQPVTRESIKAALENLSVDIGGMKVAFSPTSHTGLRYSDISIIGADERFRR